MENIMKRLLASLALALSLAACAGAPAEPGPITPNPTVSIEGIAFKPPVVTIETGDTVTWVWRDGPIQHDVVADEFRSDVLIDGTFSHSFDQAGVYEYVCSLHGNMRGTVFVQDA
jgi:plastocyanin